MASASKFAKGAQQAIVDMCAFDAENRRGIDALGKSYRTLCVARNDNASRSPTFALPPKL